MVADHRFGILETVAFEPGRLHHEPAASSRQPRHPAWTKSHVKKGAIETVLVASRLSSVVMLLSLRDRGNASLNAAAGDHSPVSRSAVKAAVTSFASGGQSRGDLPARLGHLGEAEALAPATKAQRFWPSQASPSQCPGPGWTTRHNRRSTVIGQSRSPVGGSGFENSPSHQPMNSNSV